MKKIILLLFILSTAFYAKAQNDTLLYDNFDVDNSANWNLFNNGNDTVWVSLDLDANMDANSRPGNWYWSPNAFGGFDSTGCVFSSSWFNSPAACANYFITPPIQIIDGAAVLNWKSAPRQTPRYLDGYQVLVSTTDNYEISFTDTLFSAAEYTSGGSANGFDFSLYGFTPGFQHGADSTYVEFDADSSAFVGLLRPFSVSLAQYSGQTIYICFLHDAFDDNLIALDDILVTGNLSVGINETELLTSATLYPNPSTGIFTINSSINSTFNLYDIFGAHIAEYTENTTQIDLSNYANGVYFLKTQQSNKEEIVKLILNK